MLDVPAPRVPNLLDEVETLGLTARASVFRRGTLACTGLEYCKLAITETKATASHLVQELERRLGDIPELFTVDAPPITIHVNGCPNSCARAQIADLGLRGVQLPDPDDPPAGGRRFPALGGRCAGAEAGLGRRVRGVRIRATDLPTTWNGCSAGG